jgi:4'-phosphopantetheinyl transferase
MIRWLVQTIVDHPALATGRPPPGLLSPAELEQYDGYLNLNRRRDWLLGRWTAKRLIQRHYGAVAGFHPPLTSFILAQEPDGAPYGVSSDWALVGAQPIGGEGVARLPLVISISHGHGYAFCALCGAEARTIAPCLGADIELVERRAPSFLPDFFTGEEQSVLAAAPQPLADQMVTATWSAKESVLKALRCGLRVDTRLVQCMLTPDRPSMWTPFHIDLCAQLLPEGRPHRGFTGWWRVLDNRLRPGNSFVLTLVAQGCTL